MKDYPTLTIKKQVGCGSVYTIFLEESGAFKRIMIRGDMCKEAPCGSSWFDALAAILTFSLRRALWEGTVDKGIIKHLKNHRCNMALPNKEHISSCPDAIGKAVEQYLRKI